MVTDYPSGLVSEKTKANTLVTQYYVVKKASTGVEHVAAATDIPYGVAQSTEAAGGAGVQKTILVALPGQVTKAVAGGTIAPGAYCESANGTVVTSAGDGDAICGMSLADANTASGDIFPMLVLSFYRAKA